MKLNARWVIYPLLALVLFLTVQHIFLYIKGIEYNPFQTIYRTKVVKVLEPDQLKKKERRETKLLTVQVISSTSNREASPDPKGPPAAGSSNPSDGISSPTLPENPKDSSPTQQKHLLNRYTLSETLFAGTILEVYLLPDGATEVTVAYKQPIVELGKLRELGLWLGPEIGLPNLDSDPTLSSTGSQDLGWALDLSYQQDLFRLGSAWSRLRLEAGYSSTLGTNFKAQVGIPVFRF